MEGMLGEPSNANLDHIATVDYTGIFICSKIALLPCSRENLKEGRNGRRIIANTVNIESPTPGGINSSTEGDIKDFVSATDEGLTRDSGVG